MGASADHRVQEEELLRLAIDELPLAATAKANLDRRYLEYLRWLEKAANRNLRGHQALRITAAVSAALVAAFAASSIGPAGKWIAASLGVLIAVVTAVDQVLNPGSRWLHYRGVVELLKSEGWLYVQSTGPYANKGPEEALQEFLGNVERTIRGEVREYVTSVAAQRKPGSER